MRSSECVALSPRGGHHRHAHPPSYCHLRPLRGLADVNAKLGAGVRERESHERECREQHYRGSWRSESTKRGYSGRWDQWLPRKLELQGCGEWDRMDETCVRTEDVLTNSQIELFGR